ncbi:hypothetical protein [Limosilactobacillus equigenerosi]|uniref:Cupin 2 conserved barrel domain-containing protein n=1 Tax=Limosilactobacillus equigenerosi DSM 18793 = JCM 14505 TaxID=1423742 RepID=A0A0R1UXV7_9LACO|nr:hypothetical protein [Limosilactobacillus equigenerosi]KRL96163.1 hypothetical protein FC21_GL000604 [Limosilactobacillus equigenerosi DSM 18793 = JCM 14505]
MDDYVIDFDSLSYLKPETLAIMKLLVKKYNKSKDDDVLQDGVVVSFNELAKAAKILLCVAGEGWYQEKGKPDQLLKPGYVVNISTEVKHWHGATKNSWFSHIAPGVDDPNATVTWCEPVTEEEYDKLENQR